MLGRLLRRAALPSLLVAVVLLPQGGPTPTPPPALAPAAAVTVAAAADDDTRWAKVRWTHRGDSIHAAVNVSASQRRVHVVTNGWYPRVDKYLHVGLGAPAGVDGCEVSTWIVLSALDHAGEDPTATVEGFSADGAPIGLTAAFRNTGLDEYLVALDASLEGGCAELAIRGSTRPGGGSAITGPTVRAFRPRDADLPMATVSVEWPPSVDVGVATDIPATIYPSFYNPRGKSLVPFEVDVRLAEGSGLEFLGSAGPYLVDPWHDAVPIDLVARAPAGDLLKPRLVGSSPSGKVADDPGEYGVAYGRSWLAVNHPPPTDWSGSLAGQKWWFAFAYEHSSVGGGPQPGFVVMDFIDDRWVYVEGGGFFSYDGESPATCTRVDGPGGGCHRYYYDEATGRLQIDKWQAKSLANPVSYLLPLAPYGRWHYYGIDPATRYLPVRTGARYAFRGEGIDEHVVLRLDGTFRWSFERDRQTRVVRGRYRFRGAHQELWLDPRGKGRRNAFSTHALLYFRQTTDGSRLMGIDTGRFTVLRGGF